MADEKPTPEDRARAAEEAEARKRETQRLAEEEKRKTIAAAEEEKRRTAAAAEEARKNAANAAEEARRESQRLADERRVASQEAADTRASARQKEADDRADARQQAADSAANARVQRQLDAQTAIEAARAREREDDKAQRAKEKAENEAKKAEGARRTESKKLEREFRATATPEQKAALDIERARKSAEDALAAKGDVGKTVDELRGMSSVERASILGSGSELFKLFEILFKREQTEAARKIKEKGAATDAVENEYRSVLKDLNTQMRSMAEKTKGTAGFLFGIGSVASSITMARQQTSAAQEKAKSAFDASLKRAGLSETAEDISKMSAEERKKFFENNPKLASEYIKFETANIQAKFQPFIVGLETASKVIQQFVAVIRDTQKQLGISTGAAVKVDVRDTIESFKSYINVFSTLPAVSRKEIMEAQRTFQAEFGGVLTAAAAANIVSRAKELGVTTEQLATARRVFMTNTAGNLAQAVAAEEKFISTFEAKGLTNKEAMEAISKYSDLIARNGTRFADSIARAAVEAKKIGVDLGKIDQIGDNIIDNFEGFLEAQANLGAMGFGFDTSRLAEIAAGGDTGALLTEIETQLARTGKNLDQLSRPERLELEKAFGLSISEIKKLAGRGGAGEETMEDLQREGNKFLSGIVNILEKVGGILGGISGILSFIQTISLMILASNSGGISKLSGIFTSGMAKVVGAVGLGMASIALMSNTYKAAKEGNTDEMVMSGLGSIASSAATGAMIGSAIGPGGTVAGAIIGGTIGAFGAIGAGMAGSSAKAEGGLITGPGTPTSDNILTATSPGEFVINANSTRSIGVSALNALNSQGASGLTTILNNRYAAGGLVSETTLRESSTSTAVPYDTSTMIEMNRPAAPQKIENKVMLDMASLERKLDQVVSAVAANRGDVHINVDGNQLMKTVYNRVDRAASNPVYRTMGTPTV